MTRGRKLGLLLLALAALLVLTIVVMELARTARGQRKRLPLQFLPWTRTR